MSSVTPRLLRGFLILCVFAAFVHAEDERRNGQKVWSLTDYLKGTPAELRETMNHEVERLAAERAEALPKLAKFKHDYDAAQAAVTESLDKDPGYVALQSEAARAEGALETARSVGTSQERLDAGTKYSRLKAELEKMQKDALAGDKNVALYRDAYNQAEGSVKEFSDAIGRAEKWRRTLLDATENAVAIVWPLAHGSEGVIRTVTPTKIIPGGFEAKYSADEFLRATADREGIITVQVRPHPVIVAVKGLENHDIKVGTPIDLDAVGFEIVRVTEDPATGIVCELRPSDGDVAALVKTINTLKVNLSTAELDQMVKESDQNKPNAKHWTSPAQLIMALPVEVRSRPRGIPKAALDKANDWLKRQAIRDTMEAEVKVIDVTERGPNAFTLEAIQDAGNGRQHEFVVECMGSPEAKAARLKPGAVIHVKGIIEEAVLQPDGTMSMHLEDASF